MQIECLIVDDEPIAREIVERYCKYLPELRVVALVASALEARSVLLQQQIDLIFLDINMPEIDGLSFLKTLKKPPLVIFTTAYKEFAHEAFDLAVTDYLLKPFSLERFIVAVDKAREKIQPTVIADAPDAVTESHLFVKADGKIFKVDFNDLLYAEAYGNYTKVYTTQFKIMPAVSFSQFLQSLPENQFLRVHRSFIINKWHINHVEGNRVFIKDQEIPIGSNYKADFFNALGL